MWLEVDDLERQKWTPNAGGVVEGVGLEGKHVLRIFDARGRKKIALHLDFMRRGSPDVCLAYNATYGSYQLRTLRPGRRCGPCTMRERLGTGPGGAEGPKDEP